ncbi:hypothetical protein C8Q74DRAFT_1363451 [Fomes fomentarius]|nr:hypothetical protein C8Q74DRAFT_1373582 [Fomes fomentarius]KAI0808020.1 hypothetical protein C8Q74DRAFT_1363451 [Fomes fomentarius]
MKDDYDDRFTPLAMVWAGLREPFSQPTVDTVQQIFDLAYPTSEYQVVDDDIFFKMVENHWSNWQNKMREAALEVLNTRFSNPAHVNLHSHEARARYCHKLLGGENDRYREQILHTRAPLFWKVSKAGEREARASSCIPYAFAWYKREFILLLLTSLLSRVLAPLASIGWVHLHLIDRLPKDLRNAIDALPQPRPAGALAMSALAMEFALHSWKSGELHLTKAISGQFSQKNYGNMTCWDPEAEQWVDINAATALYTRAKQLGDARWTVILRDTNKYLRDHRETVQHARKRPTASVSRRTLEPNFYSSD